MSVGSKGKNIVEYSVESGKLITKELNSLTSDSGLRPPKSSDNGRSFSEQEVISGSDDLNPTFLFKDV